ncbi:MAG: nodulation protein NfeD [Nitrospirae bacterium]|nr:nodulation protein NfeD [Nitrospirota bacterium]
MRKNKSPYFRGLLLFLCAVLACYAYKAHEIFAVDKVSAPTKRVLLISVNGIINPVAAEYINGAVTQASAMNAEAMIIQLDTPGGLDSSMRSIVRDVVGSPTPVVVYVAPSGSRSASAGVFITVASHVAAMAPGTNIGAAHPVSMGEKMDKVMSEKVTNDAAAYIRSLARQRGRNEQWVEDAVRGSVSITEAEALKMNVIDLVAKDLSELLVKLDGRKVKTVAGEKVLNTSGAKVVAREMGLGYRILDLISNPNVAYILMLLGFYGLFFELTNPGAIFPGVMGGICLILAFFALQTVPVNYAGLLLIIMGLVFFILEVKVVSHGLLTIGGIISLILGSLMLFSSSSPYFSLSLGLILTVAFVSALFFIFTFSIAFKALRRRPVTGPESLIGLEGRARTDITAEGGTVHVHGELWSAYSDEFIPKDSRVAIEEIRELKVKVRQRG